MTIANRLTVLRMLLIPAVIIVFYLQFEAAPYVAAVLFVLSALTDILDGHLARKRQEVTNFGRLIDPVADKLLVATVLIMLVDMGSAPSWAAMVIVAREMVISGIRLVAADHGKIIEASWCGKLKTIAQDVAVAGLLLGVPWAIGGVRIVDILLYIAVAMTVYSAVDYICRNRAVIWTEGKRKE